MAQIIAPRQPLVDLRTGNITQAWYRFITSWFDQTGGYSGVVTPEYGGTGISSYTAGDMLYATNATTLAKLTIGTAGQFIKSSGGLPAWAQIGPTDVAGVAWTQATLTNLNQLTNGPGYITASQTVALTNKTISGSSNTLSNIGNSSLVNSSVTINGTTVALGGSATITAVAANALTIGTGLSGTSYNGSAPVTIAIDSSVATLTGTQVLTNKELTSPKISSIVNTGTLTLPTDTDTLVGRATTDTLTNKSISGTTNTLSSIGNSSLTNSSVTIGSTSVSLGGTATTIAGLTLTAPVLGTPTSGTLTNCTGLPIGTGVAGLGTGVATALAVNTGSSGAFVVNGGALGTPSSGTVTNLTGTASININGTVGATTPATGAFTTLSASSTVTFSGGTANGVLYLNGSKVAVSGSAITFDGTNFATTGTSTATKFIPTGGSASGNGMYLSATNTVSISTNGSEKVSVNGTGDFTVTQLYSNTSGSTDYVAVGVSGVLVRSTSSLRYKTIVSYDIDALADLFMEMDGFIYTSKCQQDDNDKLRIGFGAEHADEKGLHELVSYGPDRQCENFAYDRSVVLLQNYVKRLAAELNTLKSEFAAYKSAHP